MPKMRSWSAPYAATENSNITSNPEGFRLHIHLGVGARDGLFNMYFNGTGWQNYAVLHVEPGYIMRTQISEFLGMTADDLRALIANLGDNTGNAPMQLTLGSTLLSRITQEDIAVATAKNWTVS